MNLLRRMAGTALAAGLAAGLLLSALQAIWVTPLIREAERYEAPATGPGEAPAAAGDNPTDKPQDPDGWSPAPGVERMLYTTAADVLAGVGFALLIVAGLVLHGRPAAASRGLLWATAGYAAFVLSPALGLPPEVPGAVVAPLPERQWWWVGTVSATAAALALFVFLPARAKVLGLPLLLLPHILGAPQAPLPPAIQGPPAGLVGQYVAAVMVTNAVFWAALGTGCGWLLGKAR